MDKKNLRKEILAQRNAMLEKECEKKSVQIADKLMSLSVFQDTAIILLYASMKSEVQTTKILQAAKDMGKRIYLPRVLKDVMEFYCVDETTEFETSKWGVREPKADNIKRFEPKENENILVIVPGVVFDKDGNRIGYGGGYYDKYLQRLNESAANDVYKVALAYESQLVEVGNIIREEYDILMDYIVTEQEVYKIE